MSSLLPCPGCARHVMKTETACPFCGVALTLVATAAGREPPPRLGRAARLAWGAAVAGTLVITGCGDDDSPGMDSGTMSDGGGDEDGGAVPLYGAPAADGGDNDGGGMMALYGGPPVDGGSDGGGMAVPAYGAPAGDGGSAG